MTDVNKHRYFLLCILFILFVIVVYAMPIYSVFANNIGWLKLTNAQLYLESSDRWLHQALLCFDAATNVDKSNQRAWLGRGIVHTFLNDESNAYLDWLHAKAPQAVLVGMGRIAANKRQEDIALTYYRGAMNVTPGYYDAVIGITRVCQGVFIRPEMVQSRHQRYCFDFFGARNGNILPNGNFEDEHIEGWSGFECFNNGLSGWGFDVVSGHPAPSLMFKGIFSGNPCGIYQFISLKPGVHIRLSGWFKIVSDKIEAKVLYVGWLQDSKPHGNQLQTITRTVDWIYQEREFKLPVDAEKYIIFYPVILSGQGVVWIDDLRVQILP